VPVGADCPSEFSERASVFPADAVSSIGLSEGAARSAGSVLTMGTEAAADRTKTQQRIHIARMNDKALRIQLSFEVCLNVKASS
jgi:hypothetical protein